jgi:hypothetical protein
LRILLAPSTVTRATGERNSWQARPRRRPRTFAAAATLRNGMENSGLCRFTEADVRIAKSAERIRIRRAAVRTGAFDDAKYPSR